MTDFTIRQYRELIKVLIENKYQFQPFGEFLEFPKNKSIMLRHDVDARKQNSLRFAEIQHEFGIRGSYYFRVVPESYDETVIRRVAELGHEIGYHYETMDTSKGNAEAAYHEFCKTSNDSGNLPQSGPSVCMEAPGHLMTISKYGKNIPINPWD